MKYEAYLVDGRRYDIANEKTGEVNVYTKFFLKVPCDETDYTVGFSPKELTVKGNYLKVIKERLFKKVLVEVIEVPTLKGSEHKLKKIDNIDLR